MLITVVLESTLAFEDENVAGYKVHKKRERSCFVKHEL